MWVNFFCIDVEFCDSVSYYFFIDFIMFSQFVQCCYDYIGSIDFEVVMQVFMVVGMIEVIGIQYVVIISWYVSMNLFSEQFYIVSGCYCWSVVYYLSDIWYVWGFQWVQYVLVFVILVIMCQFGEGGNVIYVGIYVVVFCQDLCCFMYVMQDRIGVQQLNFIFVIFDGFEFVDIFMDIFFGVFWYGWYVVVFVQCSDVVVNVFLCFVVYMDQIIMYDDSYFIGVCWVVRDIVWDSQ